MDRKMRGEDAWPPANVNRIGPTTAIYLWTRPSCPLFLTPWTWQCHSSSTRPSVPDGVFGQEYIWWPRFATVADPRRRRWPLCLALCEECSNKFSLAFKMLKIAWLHSYTIHKYRTKYRTIQKTHQMWQQAKYNSETARNILMLQSCLL